MKESNDKITGTLLDDIVDNFMKLIASWTKQEAGDTSSYMKLFSNICMYIQNLSKTTALTLTGVEKANMAMDSIVRICNKLMKENPLKLEGKEMDTLKMILSDQGLSLLRGATTGIKLAMKYMDKDQNGEISTEEFLESFCCCCFPKSAKKKKKNRELLGNKY